jgi:predicted transcriptional regulator
MCYITSAEATMHFNIYLDDMTGQQLNAMAQQTGESRNALIRKAVSEWLAHQSQPQWPDAVANFKGMADVPPFEASRNRLPPPMEDPLA